MGQRPGVLHGAETWSMRSDERRKVSDRDEAFEFLKSNTNR